MHTLVCEMRVNCFRKYLNLNVLALLTYKEYVKKNAPNTYNQSINCVEAETKMYYEQKSGYISFIKMGLCSFVVSTVLCKSTANEFQRISVFVLRELSPTFAEFSERKETSQTFANTNENSDQRKIRRMWTNPEVHDVLLCSFYPQVITAKISNIGYFMTYSVATAKKPCP